MSVQTSVAVSAESLLLLDVRLFFSSGDKQQTQLAARATEATTTCFIYSFSYGYESYNIFFPHWCMSIAI